MEHELLLIREIVATFFAGLCELTPASIIVRHHRPECHVLVIETGRHQFRPIEHGHSHC